MKKYAVIPARYNSVRLPGKPLLEIAGKPLVQHAYENAIKAGFDDVIIATDNQNIVRAAKQFNAMVFMTDASHQSGTDRVAEVVELLKLDDDDIVCNLQGDEPALAPSVIHKLQDTILHSSSAGMSTLACSIDDYDDVFNPNVVKVVFSGNGRALYFSRAPIPWNRDAFTDVRSSEFSKSVKSSVYHKHIGLYAYKVSALRALSRLEVSHYEKQEKLEQLRALENGIQIDIGVIDEAPLPGVDTNEDYLYVKSVMESET